jgi:hypothetical protein
MRSAFISILDVISLPSSDPPGVVLTKNRGCRSDDSDWGLRSAAASRAASGDRFPYRTDSGSRTRTVPASSSTMTGGYIPPLSVVRCPIALVRRVAELANVVGVQLNVKALRHYTAS